MSPEPIRRISPSIVCHALADGQVRLEQLDEFGQEPRDGLSLTVPGQASDFVAACQGQRKKVAEAQVKRAISLKGYAADGVEPPAPLPMMWMIPGRKHLRLIYYPLDDEIQVMGDGSVLLAFPEWELAAIAGGLAAFIDERDAGPEG
jgi:hypothetical protein